MPYHLLSSHFNLQQLLLDLIRLPALMGLHVFSVSAGCSSLPGPAPEQARLLFASL